MSFRSDRTAKMSDSRVRCDRGGNGLSKPERKHTQTWRVINLDQWPGPCCCLFFAGFEILMFPKLVETLSLFSNEIK